ncbi:MAG TPA: dienelactone hydrolase family protein [Fimbriimonadaceae bacterium]|nr:dienelactone hydrolase family protein [Fimbriimonadaceae bacterium]
MRLIVFAFIVALASLGQTQDWAKKRLADSPRHQEWVELKHGSRTLKAFVVYPEKKEKASVVVVIHEIMGLTDWVQSVADRLAESGYIAIAPDFLSEMAPNKGRTTDFEDVGKAREAVSGLSPAQVTADLNASVDYGRKIPSANGKVAVGGFCWGGTQAFRYATQRNDISAAFVFYGTGPTAASDIEKIKAPVYGFYGGNDNRVNATIPDSEKAMKAAGKIFEPVIYDGAGHGFMRAGEAPDASADNKKGFEAGWKRWLELLGKI